MPATWVEYPEYRTYEATRQEANNALMAMLAGSQLAAHTLQLTNGSTQLLPDIFPGVAEIQYFRLRTDAATNLLADVGHHLGTVAVPYVLAIHEDFVMTTLELLRERGYVTRAPGRSADLTKNAVKAWNMHEALEITMGSLTTSTGKTEQLEIFHLLREMRNCQIHAGGKVSDSLRDRVADLSPSAREVWTRWARRSPEDAISGTIVHFTKFDIFTVLANAKTLGREVNVILRDGLPAVAWAEIAVKDYVASSSKATGSDAWARSLIGHVNLLYGAVNLSEPDIMAAASRLGHWPLGRSFAPRRVARAARRPREAGTKPADS